MNNLRKGSFMAALILLSVGYSEHAYAQRCGGDLTYIVRNKKEEIIDADIVNIKYVRKALTRWDEPVNYPVQPWNYVERDSIKGLEIETGCGVYLAEIALEYEGRMMLLRFHNIPEEKNFLVDSVAFKEGTYEIDFKNDFYLKGQKLNREGLMSKEGKYVLRDIARVGRLVSAKNWKRISSKRRRI
jgi:hypothetical protein